MKRQFFWSVFFTVCFRLPIYESIAAIFWQSASYVFKMPLNWSEKLVFEQLGDFLRWIFFQVRQFDYCFQSFFSFSAFKTVQMCYNWAY